MTSKTSTEENDMQTDLMKRFNWTAEETHALVEVWSNKDLQKKLSTATRNMVLYVTVAKELRRQHGICRTAVQCREKIKKLRHAFKRVERKGLSGWKRRQECPFYDILAPVLQGNQGSPPPRCDEDSENLSRTDEDVNCAGLVGRESTTRQHLLDNLEASSSHEDLPSTHQQLSAVCEETDPGRMLIFQKDKLVSILKENVDQQQSSSHDSLNQRPSSHVTLEQARFPSEEIHTTQDNVDVDQKPCTDDLNASIQRTLPSLFEDLGQRPRTADIRVPDQQPNVRDNADQRSTSTFGRRDANKRPSTSGQENRRQRKRKAAGDFNLDPASSVKEVSLDAALKSLSEVIQSSIKAFNDAADRRLDKLLELERRRQKNEHKQVMTMLNVISRVLGGSGARPQRPDEEEDDDSDDSLLGKSDLYK